MYISRRAIQITILTVFCALFAAAIPPPSSATGSNGLAAQSRPLGGKFPRYKVGYGDPERPERVANEGTDTFEKEK